MDEFIAMSGSGGGELRSQDGELKFAAAR